MSISENFVTYFLESCSKIEYDESVEEVFHRNHPRYKALEKMSGPILDIGAGDGGMGQLMAWPVELVGKSLVGCDLDAKDTLPPFYSDWVSGGWEKRSKSDIFGGILAIHVIEHLNSWREMLSLALSVLADDGYIYIEWPVRESVSWPTASGIWSNFKILQPRFSNQLLSTFNFYDDYSHIEAPPTMKEVLTHLSIVQVIESGPIKLHDFTANLVSKGLKDDSVSNVTMGIWAEFGFAQFILAQKKNFEI
jgi:SAM-dependent methyltransferase